MWSPTCGPCKTLKPVFADLQEEFPQFKWVSVNTHDDPNGYAKKFGVQFVPTLVLIITDGDGNIVVSDKKTGSNVAEFYRMIRSALKFITQS